MGHVIVLEDNEVVSSTTEGMNATLLIHHDPRGGTFFWIGHEIETHAKLTMQATEYREKQDWRRLHHVERTMWELKQWRWLMN